MSNAPLMPVATAVWLVENTSLTFKQIAEFCNLHELEIKGIADGDVAKGIKAYNPILAGQLSREEIEICSKDPNKKLSLLKKLDEVEVKERKKPKYTPLSKRQDRPDAILWLCKNASELTDGQIVCKHDSFLGFRHGPRVVANEDALLIYLTADDKHTKLYENDLIKSIAKDARHIPAICMGCDSHKDLKNTIASFGKTLYNTNGLYILPYALIGQLLGFFKSLNLSLNPDNPSVSGAISRVVEGVNIYE